MFLRPVKKIKRLISKGMSNTLSRKKKSGKIFVGEKFSDFSSTNFSNSSLFPEQFLKLKGLS